jgi:hypothetical protein
MRRRVLIAKKRGRLAGAALGGILLGPLGALAGAVLNSKTDYYEDEPPTPPTPEEIEANTRADARSSRLVWKFVLIFCGVVIALTVLALIDIDTGWVLHQ